MKVYVNFIIVIKVSFHQHEKNMILVDETGKFSAFLIESIIIKYQVFATCNDYITFI